LNGASLQLAYLGATLLASKEEVLQKVPDPKWFTATVEGVPLDDVVKELLVLAHGGETVTPIGLINQVRTAGYQWSPLLTTSFLEKAIEAHDKMGGIIDEYTTLLRERWLAEVVSSKAREIQEAAARGEDYRAAALAMYKLVTEQEDNTAQRGDIAFEAFLESWKGAKRTRLHTGLTNLDEGFLFVSEGSLFTIGARPSTGKTSLAIQVALASARRGTPIAYYSTEMTKGEIAARMAAQLTNIPASDLMRGRLSMHGHEIDRAKEALSKLPVSLIQTNRIDETLVDIARRFSSGRAKIAVVDFIQDFRGRGGQDEYVTISNFLRDLKALAQRFGGIVVGAAQVNRGTESGGRTRPPRKSDLKGSGAFEETSDQIALIWRPPLEGGFVEMHGEIIVDKQRNGPVGSVGVIFDPQSLSFASL